MKSKLHNILQCLLHNEGIFCTLCFNSIDDLKNSLSVTEKVILRGENEKSIADILKFILDPGVSTDFITNCICLICAKSAISSYLFIKILKERSEHLSHLMNNLANVLTSTPKENIEWLKTIFLLNEDSKFQSLYDTKCNINSIETAKLRLETILSDETNEEFYSISINLEPKQQEHKLLQHKQEYELLQHRQENEQLQHKQENEHLQHELENEQLQHKKAKKRKPVANMCERDGKNVNCKICLKVFTAMTQFSNHYYRLHAPKTVKCPKCPKLFGSESLVTQHTLRSHIDAICTECGRSFTNSNYLKQHELSHRTSFPCEKCKRVYKTKKTYNLHLNLKICGQKQRKTRTEAMFTCDICNKKFCQKSSLRVHISFLHGNGKVHECTYCNKKFISQSHLSRHVLKHTKVKNFLCTICKCKFSSKEGLIGHTRLHTGEKPYKCVECDATFMSSSRRSTHVQSYHQNLQFECNECCTKFKSKQTLVRHKKGKKCYGKEVLKETKQEK